MTARAAEAVRQQALLAALWPAHGPHGETPAALRALAEHLDPAAVVPAARGLQAYRLNAGASAERALGVSFPVLRALIGDEDFAAFARAFWLARPATRGDLAWAGESLPAFIEADASLHELPWLSDVARLEWLVARAECAADDATSREDGMASLQRLADTDPSRLALRLAPGAAILRSRWPVASLWRAHGVDGPRSADAPIGVDEAALADVRAMLEAGVGDAGLVWRDGWRVRVDVVDAPTAAFLAAIVDGADLVGALDRACAEGEFAFDAWLAQALSAGVLRGVETIERAGALSGAAPGAPPGPGPAAGPGPA